MGVGGMMMRPEGVERRRRRASNRRQMDRNVIKYRIYHELQSRRSRRSIMMANYGRHKGDKIRHSLTTTRTMDGRMAG